MTKIASKTFLDAAMILRSKIEESGLSVDSISLKGITLAQANDIVLPELCTFPKSCN